MGIILDFEVVIFISYAPVDNAPLAEGQGGWVDSLVKRLRNRVRQLLGVEPEIWQAAKLIGNGYLSETLPLKPSKKPAIFIAVLSPAYINSPDCIRELEDYCRYVSKIEGGMDKSRIFKIVKTRVSEHEEPLQLQGSSGYSFYEIDPASHREYELSHVPGFAGFVEFIEQIENLAYDITSFTKLCMGSQKQNVTPTESYLPKGIEESASRRLLRVFLCHASSDKPAVRSLYNRLCYDAFDPWLDEENLLPGEEWEKEIPKAVRNSDIVLVCLSHNSINKSGYLQKEIKFALDVADEQLEGTIFLIPVKLEECDIPDRLRRWQWVDLFKENGYVRLRRALKARASKLGTATGKEI
jgi:hypothetical protein